MGAATRRLKTKQQELPRLTRLEGFNVNHQDTTAVLPPNSGQVDELETSHQPASAPGSSILYDGGSHGGFQPRTSPDRKRTGRLSEDKRFKIFCGSSNRALAEEICKFV